MECTRCNSKRLAQITSTITEGCDWVTPLGEYHGETVPLAVGISGWDATRIHFQYCLDCGQIQDQFPVPRKTERRIFSKKINSPSRAS